MKKVSITLSVLVLLLLIPITSAFNFGEKITTSFGTFKQNDCISLYQVCDDCSYVNLTNIKYPNGTIESFNLDMSKTGQNFNYTFCNTSTLGDYTYTVAGDKNGVYTIEVIGFVITSSGEDPSTSRVFAYIILFIFFILLIFTFYYTTKKINFERWYDSILRKYENKNIVKVIISSIGYNLMKNSFIWYYLFGLPLLLTITDITYTFGVNSMIEVMKVIMGIYWFGFVVVGIFFFGFLQEWVVEIVNQIKSMDYGV